jgi:hypothetical protein
LNFGKRGIFTKREEMASPSSIAVALRQSPRGQLVYERQPSLSSTNSSRFIRGGSSAEITLALDSSIDASTLAGSLADVSSVLEDVSVELSSIQLRRVANVIDRLNKSHQHEIEILDDQLEGNYTFSF